MTPPNITEAARRLNEMAFQSATNRKVVNLDEALTLLTSATAPLEKENVELKAEFLVLDNLNDQLQQSNTELAERVKELEKLNGEIIEHNHKLIQDRDTLLTTLESTQTLYGICIKERNTLTLKLAMVEKAARRMLYFLENTPANAPRVPAVLQLREADFTEWRQALNPLTQPTKET